MTTESSELTEHVARTFEAMGGVGTIIELVEAARAGASPDLDTYLLDRGWASIAGSFFRSRGNNGLPVAPEVDEHGTHMQLQLMSVEEYRYAIKRRMSGSVAYRKQAEKFAAACLTTYGVHIDVDHPDALTA